MRGLGRGWVRRRCAGRLRVKGAAIGAAARDGVLEVVVPKGEEGKRTRDAARAVRTVGRTAAGAAGSTPTDGEQEAAGRGGRVDAIREHGHVDSAFVE